MPDTHKVYSIDSSALIHGWRRVYRPKNFGLVWERLDILMDEGRLRSSIEVYNELEKKDDELFKWCKERKERMFVEIDDECQQHVTHIMTTYPRLVDTVKGRSGADPFVIALAATNNPKMIVVTEENPGKMKIPDVCNAENMEWCGLADLIEREDWKFGR
ncbi:MAG: DUF4411 family protein [Aestuariivirga sp.]